MPVATEYQCTKCGKLFGVIFAEIENEKQVPESVECKCSGKAVKVYKE